MNQHAAHNGDFRRDILTVPHRQRFLNSTVAPSMFVDSGG